MVVNLASSFVFVLCIQCISVLHVCVALTMTTLPWKGYPEPRHCLFNFGISHSTYRQLA